jgi:lipoate---protein ligase
MADRPVDPAGHWVVEHRTGTAQDLHDLDVPARPLVRVHEVTSPAVVLGSTQAVELVDPEGGAHGPLQLARRRSGGGAVWLSPGAQVWVDVVVPAGDARWDDDVERATWWLGEAWSRTLAEVLPGRRVEVHRRGVSDRAAGRVACFAAIGPGEVTIDGAKAVGVSQRRTRAAARFQCVVYRAPAVAARLLPSLTADAVAVPGVREALCATVAGLPVDVPPGWDVVERLVAHL